MPPILRPAMAMLLLSSCAGYAPVTRPPSAAQYKHATLEARVDGFSQITLRSVEKANPMEEIGGADCSLDSDELSGRVTTPAIVILPQLKGQPSPLRIDCKAGTATGQTVLTPQRMGGALGKATPRGIVGAVVSSAVSSLRDQWSYAPQPGATTLVPMIPQGLIFDQAATLPAPPADQPTTGGIE